MNVLNHIFSKLWESGMLRAVPLRPIPESYPKGIPISSQIAFEMEKEL
jgi:hypothetical protein